MIARVANEAEATTSDGHALTECYEALRREIMDANQQRGGVRGLALLMRQGMAAWMKSAAEVSEHPASAVVAAPVTQLPPSLEQRLIDIVATMAFVTARETHP